MIRSGCEKVLPALRPSFNQKPPLKHNVFRNRQDALLKHGPHLVCQPIVQLGAPSRIGDQFNAEPDLCERCRAGEETIKRLRRHEGLRLWAQVGDAAARREYSYRAANPSRSCVAHRHRSAPRLDVDVPIRRGLHGGDEGFARQIALEAPEVLRRDHNDLIATVYGHVLRPFAAHAADQLAKARLGVLQEPSTWATIPRAPTCFRCLRHLGLRCSSHAD
jgi:hypothetical protein